MADDWRRRHMFSDEKWKSLTKHFSGLERQPPAISRMAFDIVDWEKNRKTSSDRILPGDRVKAYKDAAKKIDAAIEALKIALKSSQSNFEVMPANGDKERQSRNDFLSGLLSDLDVCKIGFSNAYMTVEKGKTGINNENLKTYVWLVAEWFERNGLSHRISGGDNRDSLKSFILDIFMEFNFIPEKSAIAEAIRNYPRKLE